MGNTVQKNNITEKINNKDTQKSSASCTQTASATIKNVTVDLVDSNNNKINVENNVNVQASCVLGNSLDGTISNTQAAAAKNSSSDAMGAFNFSPRSSKQVNNITQQTNNVIKQILASSCVNTATADIDVLTLSLIGSDGNSANIANNIESNTNCAINNMGKYSVSNSQSATASNTKTEDTGFVIIIIVCIIAILAGVGIYIFIKYGKNSSKQQAMDKSMVEMQPLSSSYLPLQPSSSNPITNLASSSGGILNSLSKYATPENIEEVTKLFSEIPPV